MCCVDYLAVKRWPAGLGDRRSEAPLTLQEMIDQVLATCRSEYPMERAYMARTLERAPRGIRSDPRVKEVIASGPPHLNSWKIKGFRQNDTAGQAHPRPHMTADATKNARKLDAVALTAAPSEKQPMKAPSREPSRPAGPTVAAFRGSIGMPRGNAPVPTLG